MIPAAGAPGTAGSGFRVAREAADDVAGLKLEHCRACRDELPWGSPLPLADFIIWGKLTPPEHLGPRCADHAEKALGWNFISQVDQWAVYDLRPLNRAAALRSVR